MRLAWINNSPIHSPHDWLYYQYVNFGSYISIFQSLCFQVVQDPSSHNQGLWHHLCGGYHSLPSWVIWSPWHCIVIPTSILSFSGQNSIKIINDHIRRRNVLLYFSKVSEASLLSQTCTCITSSVGLEAVHKFLFPGTILYQLCDSPLNNVSCRGFHLFRSTTMNLRIQTKPM